jgi:outer membrane protein OmpA-like peptidoglycan-associated protein
MDVQFDHGKSQLKGSSKNAVGNMVRMMNGMPAMTIELRGHTDSTNSTDDPEFNMKLSQQRADAVKQALVNAGIKAERITAKGFGDTVPLASNSTEEGRARNRRTEFIILTR